MMIYFLCGVCYAIGIAVGSWDKHDEIERWQSVANKNGGECMRLKKELADYKRTVRALEEEAAKQGNMPEPNLEGEEWG